MTMKLIAMCLTAALLSTCMGPLFKERELNAITLYKQAKKSASVKNDDQACRKFQALKNNHYFALKHLLRVQILENCILSKEKLRKLWSESQKDLPKYLEEKFYLASYNQALKMELSEESIVYGLLYNKYPKTKKEREGIAKKLLILSNKSTGHSLKEAAQENFSQIAPRFTSSPGAEHYYKIARDFERVRKFVQARFYYNKIINNKKRPLLERMKSYYRKAMTFKLKRDKVTYSAVLENMITWLSRMPKSKFKDDILDQEKKEKINLLEKLWNYRLLDTRAMWTIDKRSQAEKKLIQYSKQKIPSGLKVKADIYLLLGLISLEKKSYQKANDYFKHGLSEEHISQETRETLSWNLSWSNYTSGNYQASIQIFKETIPHLENESLKDKYLFWTAKSYKNLGKNKEAKKILEELIKKDSFHYYNIIAHLELKKALPSLTFPQYPPMHTKNKTLAWLKALDEVDLIKKYLKTTNDEITYQDYHYGEFYEGGIFKFFSLAKDKAVKKEIYRKHLPLAFPAPYQVTTKRISQEKKIPQAFLYAIARQESAFNPFARSWADAFGLLQVTPEKAKQLAKKYDLKYDYPEDLYNVDTNLEMGSLILKKLSRQKNDNFIAIVSSYNAGRAPYNRWKKQRFRQDPFEFIEMIPYKETRNYAKLVFRNFVTYKRLLGENILLDKTFFTKKFY